MATEHHFLYRGSTHDIPTEATHITIHKSITTIPRMAFSDHPNIIEVICHHGVRRIKRQAFYRCRKLSRVIMPGVEDVDDFSFNQCPVLVDVECGKLERVGYGAFERCASLNGMHLPLVRVVEQYAFGYCPALKSVRFGSSLETMREGAFAVCPSFERMAVPLKQKLVLDATVFRGCTKLTCVDFIEVAELQETIDTLLCKQWSNDIQNEMESIQQLLVDAPSGNPHFRNNSGEKAKVIREWSKRVLGKIIEYKAEHCCLVSEATHLLLEECDLPQDIVVDKVLPFLELPLYTFDGEDCEK